MKTASIADLKTLLCERKGAQIVTFTAFTIPPMNKYGWSFEGEKIANPFHGRVLKESEVNGMIGWIYENAVSRQRIREDHPEPDFEALPRSWGTRIEGTPFVEHTKDGILHTYLEVKVEKVIEKPVLYLDDEPINPPGPLGFFQAYLLASVKSWIKVSKQAGTQETKKAIMPKDYNLNTIRLIKVNGAEYAIK